jgi:hypothetical protein
MHEFCPKFEKRPSKILFSVRFPSETTILVIYLGIFEEIYDLLFATARAITFFLLGEIMGLEREQWGMEGLSQC